MGYCENCKKVESCTKYIGIVYGFCNLDFEPKEKEKPACHDNGERV